MRRPAALLVAAGLLLLGCTSFPTIEAGVCGNRVLEDELKVPEACDTFVESKTERCRPPGDEHECQYDCRVGSDGVRPTCPVDRGCAADGVCREIATNEYEAPRTLTAERTAWLSTADFDGDGRVDLLSAAPRDQFLQARFRVHYFDEGELGLTTRVFPRETTRPVVKDVNGDQRSDFLFSTFRVGMLPGRADRDWLPATFSSYQEPSSGLRVVSVYDELVSGGSPLAVLTDRKGMPGLYVTGAASLEPRLALPATVQQLAGTPLSANIARGPTSPCNEVVFAFLNDDTFRVYDLCVVSSDPSSEVVWRDHPVEQLVHLPAGLSIDAAPFAADVNGDGWLDVVVGAAGRPYVAYGDGERLEDEAVLLEVMISDEQGVEREQLPMPLAAGDLSGDGFADFVLPDIIVSSRPRLSGNGQIYSASYKNRGNPWTMAEVADLNGNGRPDVIAASAGVAGLAFVNGSGSRYQVGATLPTEGPVQFLTTGDFDGDLINDVATAEASRSSEAPGYLVVAFGIRDTPPLPGKRIAELRDVEQLGILGEYGLDNLFVASNQSVNNEPYSTLTLFEGTPDRLPFAPYSLVNFYLESQLVDSSALAVVVGSFTAPGASDLVALGTVDPAQGWTQWLAPDIASGRHPPRLLEGEHPANILPTHGERADAVLSVAGAAADLDGDGLDEALWLMPEGRDGCALLVYDLAVRAGAAVQKDLLHFNEPCRTPELVAVDQDGDEHVDLMLLLGLPQRLHVLWNDGQGGFSLENSSILSDLAGGDIRAFSPFPGPKDTRIAFVSAAALHVASMGSADDSVREVASLEDAHSVVVLDPNGDGVSGIAIADAQGIRLFEAAFK